MDMCLPDETLCESGRGLRRDDRQSDGNREFRGESDQAVQPKRGLECVVIAQPQLRRQSKIAPAVEFVTQSLPDTRRGHVAAPLRIRPSFTAASRSERSSKTKLRAARP